MYLASFRYNGRDFLGVRWGTDHVLPLNEPLGIPADRGSAESVADGMLTVIEQGACSVGHYCAAGQRFPPSCRRRAHSGFRYHVAPASAPPREDRGSGDEQLRIGHKEDQRPVPPHVLSQAPQQPPGSSE